MPHDESIPFEADAPTIDQVDERIREIAREGARRLLQVALEKEIESHLNAHAHLLDEQGYRTVVRNGHAPGRTILSAVGPVQVRRPRLDERKARERDANHQRFTGGVLPRFLRRTPSVEGVVATLYLKGISTNDFDAAVRAISGEQAGSLSASTVSRLKEAWYEEYSPWRKRKLNAKEYACLWADGVYFNARIEGERSCIPVIIGAKYNGEKELPAVAAGYRESEESWKELLLELKDRGMSVDPLPMVPWGSGRHCRRSLRPPKPSAAGCTRRRTCSTRCPRAYSRGRRH
jgi:transposase-like protein